MFLLLLFVSNGSKRPSEVCVFLSFLVDELRRAHVGYWQLKGFRRCCNELRKRLCINALRQ